VLSLYAAADVAATCHGLAESEVLDRAHVSLLLDSSYDKAVQFTSSNISITTVWTLIFSPTP
jgi:hypothetical protein